MGIARFVAGRIADTYRTWQAPKETPVADWDMASPLIFALGIEADDEDAVIPELRWRNKTQAGPWTPLGLIGEVKNAATIALVDEATLTTAHQGTTDEERSIPGITCEQENSGIATTKTGFGNDDEQTELQCGLLFTDGTPGDEYEFALYESGIQRGISLATVTLAEGEPPPPPGGLIIFPDDDLIL